MFKQTLLFVIALTLGAVASAQEPQFRQDHPSTYTVQRGDTLWDIAERFLNTPWLWPEIWHANPDINNPHLIYPGDVISLVYIDGKPRLTNGRVSGERPTVKLSPAVRAEALDKAVTTISLDAIEPYLTRPRIISKAELDSLPYVVAGEQNNLISQKNGKIYIRGLKGEPGQHFSIVRPSHIYYENTDSGNLQSKNWKLPRAETTVGEIGMRMWDTVTPPYRENTEVLGYEVLEIGSGVMIADGDDVATVQITATRQEISKGDLLMPVNTDQFDLTFMPRAPEQVAANTRVLALSNALFGVGKFQVVALNRGIRDGVETGHVLASYTPGETIRDTVKYPREGSYRTDFNPGASQLTLPDERNAIMMVFRTFDRISYALILNSQMPVRVGDKLVRP